MVKLRSMKGIMFTLVTVVIVVLLLGEILTYLYTNTQYSSLGVQSTPGLAASSFYNNVQLNAPAFLQASLTKAAYALGAYETTYGYNDITSGPVAIASLMTNGTVVGTNMSGAMGGYTVTTYVSSLKALGGGKGLQVSFSYANVLVFQNSSGQISAHLSGLLNISSAYGTISYPISANASAPISGLPDLFGTDIGNPASFSYNKSTAVSSAYAPFITGNIFSKGNVIANALTANAGSLSRYLFAAGPLFVDNAPTSACTDTLISNALNRSRYILVTPNAQNLPNSVCGFAGLVTYQTNTVIPGVPTVPYLTYNNFYTSNLITYLRTGGRYILDGNTLSLYDPSSLQSAVYSGSYVASGFSPSYLNLAGGTQLPSSPYGAAPLGAASRQVASFNGIAGFNMTANAIPVNSVSSALNTVSFWMQWQGNQINLVPFSFGGYSIYVSANAIGFSSAGGNVLGTITNGTTEFTTTPWVHVVAVFKNAVPTASNDVLYINGRRQNLVLMNGTFPSSVSGSSTLGVGGYSSSSYNAFNGMIANLQVYNSQLSPYQVESLYLSGISSGPVNFTSLVGWWPLNGNANDYSQYHHNGAGTVSYAGLSGYAGDSLDGGSFYHTLVVGVQGISQCSNIGSCAWNGNSKLYVPVQQGYSSNTQQQATNPLGLVNNTVPGSAYFNSAQNNFFLANAIPFNSLGNGYNTVSFWMDWVQNGGTVVPFWFNNFGFEGSSNCFGITTTASGSGSIWGVSASQVSSGWVNVVATLDNAANPATGASIYVNGVMQTPSACNGAPGSGTTAGSNAMIGGVSGSAFGFSGSIADVQVYNTLLNQANVISLYLNNTVKGVTPVAWWPLSSGNNGFTNQTFAITGNYAVEHIKTGAVCPISNSIGLVAPCSVTFLPFGPK